MKSICCNWMKLSGHIKDIIMMDLIVASRLRGVSEIEEAVAMETDDIRVSKRLDHSSQYFPSI